MTKHEGALPPQTPDVATPLVSEATRRRAEADRPAFLHALDALDGDDGNVDFDNRNLNPNENYSGGVVVLWKCL